MPASSTTKRTKPSRPGRQVERCARPAVNRSARGLDVARALPARRSSANRPCRRVRVSARRAAARRPHRRIGERAAERVLDQARDARPPRSAVPAAAAATRQAGPAGQQQRNRGAAREHMTEAPGTVAGRRMAYDIKRARRRRRVRYDCLQTTQDGRRAGVRPRSLSCRIPYTFPRRSAQYTDKLRHRAGRGRDRRRRCWRS